MMKFAVITTLVSLAWVTFDWSCLFNKRQIIVTETLNTSYDYVIVGSGSAGSVLATRLSEREDVSVLLLEAGGHFDENPVSHIPGYWADMLHTDFDWDYYTEPQKTSSFGLKSGKSYWPRGRTLGGTNILNLMQYTRGSRFDYDGWEAAGCTGWSYENVLPYFKKSEDMLIPELVNSEYHGQGGPVGVSEGRVSELQELYLKAGSEMGFNIVDYNGEAQEGFSPYQLNVRNGVRSSTSKEFLPLAEGRQNLHVGIRSFVTKIEIENRRATGVHVIRNGKKIFIKAVKEVILSAGAINSPQLLMLSGIGPKAQLDQLGIPVIEDLPVGKNLQDHLRVQLWASITKPVSITPDMKNGLWSRLNYRLFGKGALGKTVAETTAFLHVDENSTNETGTDMQFNLFSSYQFSNVVNFKEGILEEIFRDKTRKYGFMTILIMNHPHSIGAITLKSNDPFDKPIIDPKYLSEGRDIDNFIKAIRIWEEFVQTPTMSSLGTSFDQLELSFCKQHDFRSDAYWECYVRHLATTTYHPCCTCKMGPPSDETAVVDPTLRVKGISGLRVVDCSILPQETSGNLNAPVVMVAEKAADIILNQH